jgi:7,8-dihydropterin-6-yl-methyl-4-(beta-D-ribofuranosyl)aminobenzene 5'-phosphate synthase
MIGVEVLLENTRKDERLASRHGLSIAIRAGASRVLLDTGPDDSFARNADKMGVDLAAIDAVALSHAHYDHTGGLDELCKRNASAPIFLLDSVEGRYYSTLFWRFKVSVGLKCSAATKKRITSVDRIARVADGLWLVPVAEKSFPRPTHNRNLFMKVEGRFEPDDFRHEGVLVAIEGEEMALFNSCSHTGVLNSIASAKKAFPGKRVRSYVGGFHFFNPISKEREEDAVLDRFVAEMGKEAARLYTGHCTGEYCFAYLKERLGDRIERISTGTSIEV